MEIVGKYCLVQVEDQSYQSKSGIVAPKDLQKAGNTLRGVLIGNFFPNEEGVEVEFVRNQAYQIRERVYAVEPEYILVKGNLDKYLEEFNKKEE